MQVAPITLQGREIRLEPLTLDHAPALWRQADPAIFAYIPHPVDDTLPAFETYLSGLLRAPDYQPFAMVRQETGQSVGVTCYMDIRPAHRGLEIGSTWIARPYQGTRVNPESKYLLLRHAFENLGAVRVQLKTDGRNRQSQAAIAKLGAQREGVLRKHLILQDGYIRDTVMFSIIAEEWPAVKAGLETRLGYAP
ncbi:MAG TPA: GNAT family protein [Chloroflexia bacterium]|jgi:ribosomal-protein-alanine N-acetyltransferase|nr:GNAT family protein [Chloroflexia bacterium]